MRGGYPEIASRPDRHRQRAFFFRLNVMGVGNCFEARQLLLSKGTRSACRGSHQEVDKALSPQLSIDT